jgi:hypothetical protein
MGITGITRNRVTLLAMTGAVLAGVIGLAVPAGAAPAAPGAASGTEHVQIMTTSATALSEPAIGWGLFTGAGTELLGTGSTDTFTFPGGSFKETSSNPAGPSSFNPKTCLFRAAGKGTYKISGGTGTYKGISGHGAYTISDLGIDARTKGGSCNQNAAPIAFQQVITETGPVKLG